MKTDAILCWNPVRKSHCLAFIGNNRPKENLFVDGEKKKHDYFYIFKKEFSEMDKFTNLKNVSLFSKQ